jgi:hypothetical protein
MRHVSVEKKLKICKDFLICCSIFKFFRFSKTAKKQKKVSLERHKCDEAFLKFSCQLEKNEETDTMPPSCIEITRFYEAFFAFFPSGRPGTAEKTCQKKKHKKIFFLSKRTTGTHSKKHLQTVRREDQREHMDHKECARKILFCFCTEVCVARWTAVLGHVMEQTRGAKKTKGLNKKPHVADGEPLPSSNPTSDAIWDIVHCSSLKTNSCSKQTAFVSKKYKKFDTKIF